MVSFSIISSNLPKIVAIVAPNMRTWPHLINEYLGFVALAWALVAQPVNAARTLDSAQLGEALKFYQSMAEINVSFEETKHLKDMGLDLKSNGRLRVVRPDQVEWEILNPSHLLLKINKKTIEMISGEK